MKQQFDRIKTELGSALNKQLNDDMVWFALLLSILSILKQEEDQEVLAMLKDNKENPNDEVLSSPWGQRNLVLIQERAYFILSNIQSFEYKSSTPKKNKETINTLVSKVEKNEEALLLNAIISKEVPVRKVRERRVTFQGEKGTSSSTKPAAGSSTGQVQQEHDQKSPRAPRERVAGPSVSSPPKKRHRKKKSAGTSLHIPAEIAPAKITEANEMSTFLAGKKEAISVKTRAIREAMAEKERAAKAELQKAVKAYQSRLKLLNLMASVDPKTLYSKTAREDVLDYFAKEVDGEGHANFDRLGVLMSREPVATLCGKGFLAPQYKELRDFYRTIAHAGLSKKWGSRDKATKMARKTMFTLQLRLLNEQMQIIQEKLGTLNQGRAAGRVNLAHQVAVDIYGAVAEGEINLFKDDERHLKQVNAISGKIDAVVINHETEDSFNELEDTMKRIDQEIKDSWFVKSKLKSIIRSHSSDKFEKWKNKDRKIQSHFDSTLPAVKIEKEDLPLFNEACAVTITRDRGVSNERVRDYLSHLEKQERSQSLPYLYGRTASAPIIEAQEAFFTLEAQQGKNFDKEKARLHLTQALHTADRDLSRAPVLPIPMSAAASHDLMETRIHRQLADNYSTMNGGTQLLTFPPRIKINQKSYPRKDSENEVAKVCNEMYRTLFMRYMGESVAILDVEEAAARWEEIQQKVKEFDLSDSELEIYIALCLRAHKFIELANYAAGLEPDEICDQSIASKEIQEKIWHLIAPAHEQDYGPFYYALLLDVPGENSGDSPVSKMVQAIAPCFLDDDDGLADIAHNLNKVFVIFKWGNDTQIKQMHERVIDALKRENSQEQFDKIFLHYLSLQSVEDILTAFNENNAPVQESSQPFWLNLCELLLSEEEDFQALRERNPLLWNKFLPLFDRYKLVRIIAEKCLVSPDKENVLKRVDTGENVRKICRYYEGQDVCPPADFNSMLNDIFGTDGHPGYARKSDLRRLESAYNFRKSQYLTDKVKSILGQNRLDLLADESDAVKFDSARSRELFLRLQKNLDPHFEEELLGCFSKEALAPSGSIQKNLEEGPPFFYFTLASLVQLRFGKIYLSSSEEIILENDMVRETVHLINEFFHGKDIFAFMDTLTREQADRLSLLNRALLQKESAKSEEVRNAIRAMHHYVKTGLDQNKVESALQGIPSGRASARSYLQHIFTILVNDQGHVRDLVALLLPADEDLVLKNLEAYIHLVMNSSYQNDPKRLNDRGNDEVDLFEACVNYEDALKSVNITNLTINMDDVMDYCKRFIKADSYFIIGARQTSSNNLSTGDRERLSNRLLTCYNLIKLKGTDEQRTELNERIRELENFYLEHGILHNEEDPPVRLNLCEKLFELDELGSAGAAAVRSARRGKSEKLHMSYEAYCARRYLVLHELTEQKLQEQISRHMRANDFIQAARLIKAWFLAKDYFEWLDPSDQILAIIRRCIPFENDTDMQEFVNSKIFEVAELSSDIPFKDELDDIKRNCQANLDFSDVINNRLIDLIGFKETSHVTKQFSEILKFPGIDYLSTATKIFWQQDRRFPEIQGALSLICEGNFIEGVNKLNFESRADVIRERILLGQIEREEYRNRLIRVYLPYAQDKKIDADYLFEQGKKFADELNNKVILPEEDIEKAFQEGLGVLWKWFQSSDLKAIYHVFGLCACWEGRIPDDIMRDLSNFLISEQGDEGKKRAQEFALNNLSNWADSNKPNAVILKALYNLNALKKKSDFSRDFSRLDFDNFIEACKNLGAMEVFRQDLNKVIWDILNFLIGRGYTLGTILTHIGTLKPNIIEEIIYENGCPSDLKATGLDKNICIRLASPPSEGEISDFLECCKELTGLHSLPDIIRANITRVVTQRPLTEEHKLQIQELLEDKSNLAGRALIVAALKSKENKTFAIEQLLKMTRVESQKEWAVFKLLGQDLDFHVDFEEETEKEAFLSKWDPRKFPEEPLLQLVCCQLWIQNDKADGAIACFNDLFGGNLEHLAEEQEKFENTDYRGRASCSPIQKRLQSPDILKELKGAYSNLSGDERSPIIQKLMRLTDLLQEHDEENRVIASILCEMPRVLNKLVSKVPSQEQQQGQSSQPAAALAIGKLRYSSGGRREDEAGPSSPLTNTGPSRSERHRP